TTAAVTWYAYRSATHEARERFDGTVQGVRHAITSRLNNHLLLLRGAAGLFASSDSVTHRDFRDFVATFDVRRMYPGVQGIGYVAMLERGSEARFIAAERAHGFPDFTISPDSSTGQRAVVALVEPTDARNVSAAGFDLFTEPTRRAALEAARDSGDAVATGRVTLRGEPEVHRQAGFLIFIPTYRRGAPVRTVAERRAALTGFVFGAFRADDLFSGILGADSEHVDIRVYDGTTPDPATLVHDSRRASGDSTTPPAAAFTGSANAKVVERPWLVTVSSREAFRTGAGLTPFVFATGLVLSALFFGIARSRSRAALDLRLSEARFRSLVEQSLLSTHVLRPDGTTSLVNAAWRDLWGTTLDALAGYNILHDSQLEAKGVLPLLRRAFAGERVQLPTLAYQPERGDVKGVERWVRSFAYPVTDEAGVVTEVVLVHEDVTAGHRAEEQLRYQLDLTETITRNAGDALFLMDEAGCVTFLNPAAERLLGWTRDEILGKPLHDTVHYLRPDGSPLPLEESPLGSVFTRAEPVRNHQDVFIRKDGTMVPVVCSNAPIVRDGRVTSAVLVVVDDTARHQAEEARNRLAAIVEGSDDAIVGTTADGTVQTWNAAAARIFGYRAAEIVGKPVLTIVPPELHDAERSLLGRIIGGERIEQAETIRLARDGHRVDVALSSFPVHVGGGITTVATVMRDITERRRTDEALRHTQKLESIGVLAGGIAHDFNNLLTGILGNASLALAELPPASPSIELLEDVIRASERAADLTNQLLAYAGKGRFFVEPLDIGQLIRGITSLIRSSISKKVDLRLDLAGGVPWVEADASQLQQLIMNLVINGAESMGEGSGQVVVRTSVLHLSAADALAGFPGFDLAAGEYVRVEVRDTGSGMDQATIVRIFDPFFTTKFMGRGLGLAAALGIVRGHHGGVVVESVSGRGTRFTVVLPAARADASIPLPERAPHRAPAASGGVVLVADDEELVRRLAHSALTNAGYEVLLAENGQEAVALFGANGDRVRAALVDLTMPVLGGAETVAQLRRLRPSLPVVISSGYGEAEALGELGGSTGVEFLQKPYSVTALVEAVERVITSAAALLRR
ncbi:MAG: PAS domain S-box protein, partial [Gemmatimonadales bacterium]|nr:PAS domain S-box protein [Gemmatimonadales bacterium]